MPKRADAFLGIADITINPEGVVGWITDVTFKGLELALQAALEALKKRLLDEITNNIIEWIQGDGKPKFVEDLEGTLEDAKQAAVGDVVQEIGLGRICQPFKARLQINLSPVPRFQQNVSCTLDQIVGNFEDFYNDFEAGGWIGYSEALKPQNNYYGVLINSFEEANSRAQEAADAKSQEIQAGKGFLSVKRCDEWQLTATDKRNGEKIDEPYPVSNLFYFPSPSDPPPKNHAVVSENFVNMQWKCSRDRVTTPGTAIATGLEMSLYSDIGYLESSHELSAYVGAILDAAINRLIKEGVEGVQNLTRPDGSSQSDCADLRTQAARDACEGYNSIRQDAADTASNAQDQLTEQQADLALRITENITESLSDAIAINHELALTTQNLINCQSSRGSSCAQNPDLTTIQNRITQMENEITTTETLISQINQVRRDLLDPDMSRIEKLVRRQILERLGRQLEEKQREAERGLTQARSELERVKNELNQCQNGSSYSCPAP